MGEINDIIIVSNRLPIRLIKRSGSWICERSPGGLVSALSGAKGTSRWTWFGWPGSEVPASEIAEVESLIHHTTDSDIRCQAIFLTEREEQGFYNGFSNSVIWPLFHYLPGRVDFNLPFWDEYKKVNEKFANVIAENVADNATVWIHDYQLCLLPQLLRQKKPSLKIGFFLHIPFPSSEIYRLLPARKELLQGMLGADLIGFHTLDYARHFASSALRICGVESDSHSIVLNDRTVQYGAFPIGIEPELFRNLAADEELNPMLSSIKLAYQNMKVVLGVDRIDYSKGLIQKFTAFETFLKSYPEWVGNVALIQVAIPSRLEVNEYQSLKQELDEIVGRINGSFGTSVYTPVSYLAHSISKEELAALYRCADALLVTPVRDGMNLVSLEYVACQNDDNPGVLLLSEFAGSSRSLGGAMLINPWDHEGLAQHLHEALCMNVEDKKARMLQNKAYVNRFTSHHWAQMFLKTLSAIGNKSRNDGYLLRHAGDIESRYYKREERLFFFDYDGTLTPIVKKPELAVPSARLLNVLKKLTDNPKNQVYLLSGRKAKDLQDWFGHLNLHISAEHGFLTRSAQTDQWIEHHLPNLSWVKMVAEIFEAYTQKVLGSWTEVKKSTVVWHYREANQEYAMWQAQELRMHLDQLLTGHAVKIVPGKMSLEVRPTRIHKGIVISEAIAKKDISSEPFLFCCGDDVTDEDMFVVANETTGAVTCRIGYTHQTAAQYWLHDPLELLELLERLQ